MLYAWISHALIDTELQSVAVAQNAGLILRVQNLRFYTLFTPYSKSEKEAIRPPHLLQSCKPLQKS